MADPSPVVGRGRGGGGGRVPDGHEQGAVTAGHHPLMPSSRFRTVVSMLHHRTGHARFRRGPVVGRETAAACPGVAEARDLVARCDDGLPSASSASSSFPSSVTGVTGEGSVSNGAARALPPAAGAPSAGRGKSPRPPPMQLQSASDHSSGHGLKHNSDGGDGERCHCSKKRKKSSSSSPPPTQARRRIRVLAISSRNADIPPDDYSWRKYGQKPIKGSPFPRGYYKCSTVRGCPARKHVERDPGEPAMLIVTYDGDHRHGGEPGAAVPELASVQDG